MLEIIKKIIPQMLGGPSDNLYNKLFDKWIDTTFRARVRKIRPSRILEIGVFRGWEARRMIEAAKEASVKDVEYFGFDTFEGPPPDEPNPRTEVGDIKEVKRVLSSLNVKFRLFKGDTRETLTRNVPNLPKMDLIYIDGGHSYKTVKSDWENVKKLMHKRTVVIFDDYSIDGVARVVNEITGYDIKIVHLGVKKKQAVVRPKVV
jgi:hypothetical protein